MTEDEDVVLRATVDEIMKTIILTKHFGANVTAVLNQYKNTVAELKDEVRALKYDTEQRDRAIAAYESDWSSQENHHKFVCGELKNQLQSAELEIDRLQASLRMYSSLFWVAVGAAAFLTLAFIKGVIH